MTQLYLYTIAALVLAVIILAGGWFVSDRIASAEIDTLTQKNVTLTSAVETNEKTIAQMVAEARTLAAANQKLTHSIMASEMEQAASWNAIDALDLESDTGDTAELEARANSTFSVSVQALRLATSK